MTVSETSRLIGEFFDQKAERKILHRVNCLNLPWHYGRNYEVSRPLKSLTYIEVDLPSRDHLDRVIGGYLEGTHTLVIPMANRENLELRIRNIGGREFRALIASCFVMITPQRVMIFKRRISDHVACRVDLRLLPNP